MIHKRWRWQQPDYHTHACASCGTWSFEWAKYKSNKDLIMPTYRGGNFCNDCCWCCQDIWTMGKHKSKEESVSRELSTFFPLKLIFLQFKSNMLYNLCNPTKQSSHRHNIFTLMRVRWVLILILHVDCRKVFSIPWKWSLVLYFWQIERKKPISFGNEFLVNFVIEKRKNTKGVLCLLHSSFPLSYFEHVSCWISQHFQAWHSLKCWQPHDSVEKWPISTMCLQNLGIRGGVCMVRRPFSIFSL